MAFPQEFKTNIINKALNYGTRDLQSFAKSHNVGYSTLQKWLKEYRENSGIPLKKKKNKGVNEKINVVLHASKLDEEALGAYCRENGIYKQQLDSWCEEVKMIDPEITEKHYNEEINKLRAKNEQLERELQRKEKALAETAALLVLQKKVQALFAQDEES